MRINGSHHFVISLGEDFAGVRTACKPRANNRHLKRKIEYPVLRYGRIDQGGLDNIVARTCKIIADFGVYQ
jgi:hypothetical protein